MGSWGRLFYGAGYILIRGRHIKSVIIFTSGGFYMHMGRHFNVTPACEYPQRRASFDLCPMKVDLRLRLPATRHSSGSTLARLHGVRGWGASWEHDAVVGQLSSELWSV